MTDTHTPREISPQEWVDTAIAGFAGIGPQRLRSLPDAEKTQFFDRWSSRFTAAVDETTGATTVSLGAGLLPAEREARRSLSPEVVALGRRVEVLGRDALGQLDAVTPILPHSDDEEIDAARMSISNALEGLIAEFATGAWPEAVDLWIDGLVGEDDQKTEGAVGRLGELTGLVEPWQTTTAADDHSLTAYLTVAGHVRCIAAGWAGLRDRIGDLLTFSQVSAAVEHSSQCVITHVERVTDILWPYDECLGVEVSDEDDERLQLPIADFLEATAIQARGWERAARRGRTEILAIQAFVDMFTVKYERIAASVEDLFGSVLPEAELPRVRSAIERLTAELSELSSTIAALKDQPAAAK